MFGTVAEILRFLISDTATVRHFNFFEICQFLPSALFIMTIYTLMLNFIAIGWTVGELLQTRNTFCGTWCLPHSRVHKSIAELCSNFGDSVITKGQIAYFYCACAKRTYFYFRSKIWRHHRVAWPRFAIRFRNFGNSAINKGQIAYFSLRMRETDIFLLPVKNPTSLWCSKTQFPIRCRKFGDSAINKCQIAYFFIANARNAYISTSGQKIRRYHRVLRPWFLSLIHIWRCRRIERCRSRWSPYH